MMVPPLLVPPLASQKNMPPPPSPGVMQPFAKTIIALLRLADVLVARSPGLLAAGDGGGVAPRSVSTHRSTLPFTVCVVVSLSIIALFHTRTKDWVLLRCVEADG